MSGPESLPPGESLSVYEGAYSTSTASGSRGVLTGHFRQGNTSKCENEISLYLAEGTVQHLGSNPPDYSKDNCRRLPTLSTIARKVLCIPATSAPKDITSHIMYVPI